MAVPPVGCDRCGVSSGGDAPPLTWSTSVEGRGDGVTTRYFCERCTRENVRSIESKLDTAWW